MARPRWGQVRQFCRVQGYRETHTDHFYYDKALADGSSSGTKVSFGKDSEEVPPSLWKMVWHKQLRLVDEAEFWSGLDGGPIRYAIPSTPEPPERLPAYLERFLRETLHYSDDQIAAIVRDDAQELLNDYYASQLRATDP